MAIQLTNPAPLRTAKDVAISEFKLATPHELDGNGVLKIHKPAIYLLANITTYDTDGEPMSTAQMALEMADIPPAGRTMLKDFYAWLEAQAIARGFSADGTPEPLEP